MQRLNYTYSNGTSAAGAPRPMQGAGDWGAEINGSGMDAQNMRDQMGRPANETAQWPEAGYAEPMNGGGMAPMNMNNGSMAPMNGGSMTPSMNMNNHLSADVVESPTSLREAYEGSLKSYLNQNKGNFVVATFLIGTQGTVSFEGILFEVGNDYLTIYQQGRDRYVVCDVYSLKYIEFYDMERRRLCDRLIREQGGQPNRYPDASPVW